VYYSSCGLSDLDQRFIGQLTNCVPGHIDAHTGALLGFSSVDHLGCLPFPCTLTKVPGSVTHTLPSKGVYLIRCLSHQTWDQVFLT